MEAVVFVVGVLRLLTLLGLAAMVVVTLPLLTQNPRHRHFFGYAVLAGMSCMATILSIPFKGQWLHITYGALTSLLMLALSGLEPDKGWFYQSMKRPPPTVGPYLAWGSWVGIMLWLRFVQT